MAALDAALALLFLPASSFANGGGKRLAARREAAAVAAITKEAAGMAAVGGPDMPGAGWVVTIHIGAGAVVIGRLAWRSLALAESGSGITPNGYQYRSTKIGAAS
jgi:hypothetical protein